MQNTILVAGTGRSGTTWAGEVIARATGARMVFEPFLMTRDNHFACRLSPWCRRNFSLYVPPLAGTDSVWYEPIRRILDGPRPRRHAPRLIKEIRANLMLGYLAHTWPTLKIILILRNPYDVIESQLAKRRWVGWDFDWSHNAAFRQPELMHDLLAPYRAVLASADTVEERLACRWCIETLAPLRQAVPMPNLLLRWYHELAGDESAWEPIREYLEPHPWSEAEFRAQLPVRSSTSRWLRRKRRLLSPAQTRRIGAVIRGFQLESLLDGAHIDYRSIGTVAP